MNNKNSPFIHHCQKMRCRRAGRCRKQRKEACAGMSALRGGVPKRLMAMVAALGVQTQPHVADRR